MVPEEVVLAVLDRLAAAGVRCWVDGGWGVDALLGRRTRDHGDLDLALLADDLELAQAVLHEQGFRVLRDWSPTALAMRDDLGHEVDLHPLEPAADGGGDQVLLDGVTRYHYLPPVTGRIAGRPVACCPLETQLTSHLGYEPRQQDRHDLAVLAERFGVALPAPYGRTGRAGPA